MRWSCPSKSWLVCVVLIGGCYDEPNVDGGTETDAGTGDGTGGSDATNPAMTSPGSMDDDGGDDGVDDGATTEPVGPESCAGGAGLCVSAPEGWSGPVAVATAAAGSTPDCAGLEPMITAHGDLDAPPPTCACDCMAAEGASCATALLNGWGTDAACATATVYTQVINPDTGAGDPCNFMPSGENTGEVPLVGPTYWTITTESTGGSCTPAPTVDIAPASYLSEISGCTAVALDMTCDDGSGCYEAPAAPFAAGLCVWQTGDVECPAGAFSVRTVHHQGDLADSRTCSECTCGDATGSCPTSEAQIYEGYYCNDASIAVTSGCSEVCIGVGCETYAISSTLTIGAAEATCPPTGGELTGELVEQDPVTFCCTP